MGSVKKIRMKLNTIPSKFSHMPLASPSQEVESTSTSVLPGLSTFCKYLLVTIVVLYLDKKMIYMYLVYSLYFL